MADRLQELLQQRALIKEHLAWIEGEIAAASGRPVEIQEPARVLTPVPLPSLPLPPAPSIGALRGGAPMITGVPARDNEDALIAKLAEEERAPAPTKKGCWIFFLVTLAGLAIAAWALLFYFYRG